MLGNRRPTSTNGETSKKIGTTQLVQQRSRQCSWKGRLSQMCSKKTLNHNQLPITGLACSAKIWFTKSIRFGAYMSLIRRKQRNIFIVIITQYRDFRGIHICGIVYHVCGIVYHIRGILYHICGSKLPHMWYTIPQTWYTIPQTWIPRKSLYW